MDQAEFKSIVDATVRDTAAILVAKGEEYAGSTDRLANFKRGASLTGATALQVCFIYASKHYDSIATFVKKDAQGFEQRLSEPIEGRFDDLINYCMLMKALVIEAQQLKPKKGGFGHAIIQPQTGLNKPYRNIELETQPVQNIETGNQGN